jgi:hypothetical protein
MVIRSNRLITCRLNIGRNADLGLLCLDHRRVRVRLLPQALGDRERRDLEALPPGQFIARLMQLPMVAAAQRHGELDADLHAQRCLGGMRSNLNLTPWRKKYDETSALGYYGGSVANRRRSTSNPADACRDFRLLSKSATSATLAALTKRRSARDRAQRLQAATD